jgi:hypothetical protein
MIVRTGFVSNSSSTVFIIALKDNTKEQCEAALKMAYALRPAPDIEENHEGEYMAGVRIKEILIRFERNEEWAGELAERIHEKLTKLGVKFDQDEW